MSYIYKVSTCTVDQLVFRHSRKAEQLGREDGQLPGEMGPLMTVWLCAVCPEQGPSNRAGYSPGLGGRGDNGPSKQSLSGNALWECGQGSWG